MIKRFVIKPLDDGAEASPCGSAVWTRVGRQLRRRRTQLGLDIGHVARNVGISAGTYQTYESGVQAPAMLLAQIADLFGVPVMWFFQDSAIEPLAGADAPVPVAQPVVYRVATEEHRLQALADSFRKLDLEAQQHLLALSKALSGSDPRGMQD